MKLFKAILVFSIIFILVLLLIYGIVLLITYLKWKESFCSIQKTSTKDLQRVIQSFLILKKDTLLGKLNDYIQSNIGDILSVTKNVVIQNGQHQGYRTPILSL